MAQNGRVQLPRAFLVVILFGGELLTVLRNESLAIPAARLVARPCAMATAVPFWCPCIDGAIPQLRKSRQQSASLPFFISLRRIPRADTGTADQILGSRFALGIRVWSCRDLPLQSRFVGCWRPGSSK